MTIASGKAQNILHAMYISYHSGFDGIRSVTVMLMKIHSSYHYPLVLAIVAGHKIKNINTNNVVSHTFYLFEGLLLGF